MAGRVAEFEVLGPWSLETSRRFWAGFTPAALPGQPAGPGLRTVFCAEGDWRRAEAEVTQAGHTAHVVLAGDGDLDAAAAQVCRFLALDVDGRDWPGVGRRPNAPDALPRHERRLDAEIAERYGSGRTLGEVSEAWRPYRTWAAVCLRALREQRTGEIAGH
jgi:hypothetical protein